MLAKRIIPFIIAVIVTLTCLISFIISISKSNNLIADIAFGWAGLYCFLTALKIYKTTLKGGK